MSIASEIQRIKNNISNLFAALEEKGATLPSNPTSNDLVSVLDTVPVGGGSGSKFGATLDQWVGVVNDSGKLVQDTSEDINLVFNNVKDVGDTALQYKWYANRKIKTVAFPDLESISGANAFYYCFRECPFLHSISFPKLKTVSGNGFYHTFSTCESLTSVEFPALTSFGMSGANYLFNGCTKLTSVSFPALKTLGVGALKYAFSGCTKLTSVSFPSLTSVSANGLTYAFNNCTSLESIEFPSLSSLSGGAEFSNGFAKCTNLKHIYFPALHSNSFKSGIGTVYKTAFNGMFTTATNGCTLHFPSNMESTISGLNGYSTGFGGTNTIILYDLDATE